jgi:hypothetical protein
MHKVLDYPALVGALSFLALWLAARLGATLSRAKRSVQRKAREDFNTIMATTLTLSGLIIGFTFSMAIGRYEQRKGYEEAEANAIGTEYLRVDLLQAADAAKLRSVLMSYLDARISFYVVGNGKELQEINIRTEQLQTELWSLVRDASVAQPTPLAALAVAGMNDVLNSQGYTQAAWWNRIPISAWILMLAIAAMGNLLIGYGAENDKAGSVLLLVLPAVLSVSFLLIADIESPRGGIIRVAPQNLSSLAQSLHATGSPAAVQR